MQRATINRNPIGFNVGSNLFELGWDENNRSAFTTNGVRIVVPTMVHLDGCDVGSNLFELGWDENIRCAFTTDRG